MEEANTLFTLDGVNLAITCTTKDKMKDICKNYSNKINKNMDSLIFLYEGNKVNFDLSFEEQANNIDRNNHEMKILVDKNDNNIVINNNLKVSNTINIKSNSGNIDFFKNGNLFENINSKYISKILFSYLNEKFKLNVIKYNKKLQNKIDINLINYKFYSGKYIIYETNNIGKEYEGKSDNLLFEGEYSNGKRNGKGKEYYKDGKLRFEGEYLNRVRLNGKLYDNYGNFYCDLNNLNGLVKKYSLRGELEFEGEYLNGKRNGKGKEYIFSNLIFEGEYLNDKKMEKEKNTIM